MNRLITEDCRQIYESGISWDEIYGKVFLITGATGLIGSNLIYALAYTSREADLGLKLILPVRNIDKAKVFFSVFECDIDIEYIIYDILSPIKYDGNVDYIIHAAAPTDSKTFVNKPVEVLNINYISTDNILKLALEKNVERFIYLSTMEVYGNPPKNKAVKEEDIAAFEPSASRNSYPISKIAAESLCDAYYNEYDLSVNVIRLTQTFGQGVRYEDNRIFAEIARCVIEKRDIVLKTRGLTERMYLYTSDAVEAIFTILLNGKLGETYTVANEATYISIAQMAECVASEIAGGSISVRYGLEDDLSKYGYADTLYMRLDTSKIKALGWEARVGLVDAYRRMIDGMKLAEGLIG